MNLVVTSQGASTDPNGATFIVYVGAGDSGTSTARDKTNTAAVTDGQFVSIMGQTATV